MHKIEHMKNGYIIDNDTTDEEWQNVCNKYEKIKFRSFKNNSNNSNDNHDKSYR